MASILLIEDDPIFSSTLLELLREFHRVVEAAESAVRAVELARQRSFHLVISDVRIAGNRDGISALAEIKELQPHIRSIIMTGYADLEVPVQAARLQADDYLQKPFALQALLQSVRSVLERETSFRGLFQRLLDAPAGATQKALRMFFDGQRQRLQQARAACVQRFFVLVRSQRLDREQAYVSFCRWEELELEALRANTPAHWNQLTQAYAELDWLNVPRRPSPTLSKALFFQLYQKIQAGQVEAVHLQKAVALLHQPEARRENVEAYCTYHWLWSDSAAEDDPFLGLTIGKYTLRTRRHSQNQHSRLYETDTGRGDLVLCLPANPEQEGLIQHELRGGRASLLQSQLGHHFLLYPGQALSLQFNLPAEGVSARQAWQLLRPVFLQVEAQHRQKRYSGCFSLQDVECLPGQPCQLSHFSDRAYRLQHQRLHQGGTIPVEFNSAPEIHRQPEPTAASDQAVLGRLLLEVVYGGRYPDPTTPLHLRFLGSAEANDHMRPWMGRMAPLARAFYRLCHADPARRFADLAQAIRAIDALWEGGPAG